MSAHSSGYTAGTDERKAGVDAMVRLYFIHPLQHDGREIVSVIADSGIYGEMDTVSMLQNVRTYMFSDGSELDVDGGRMTVFNQNVAAVYAWDDNKE